MYSLDSLIRRAGGSDPRLALAAVGYDWGRIGRLLGVSRQAARQRFERLAPTVGGPLPPHLRGRTVIERHAAELAETRADLARRRAFDGDDPVLW